MAKPPDDRRLDLLQGTLDMLVLKALQLEPMHGWGITERIEQWSQQVLHEQRLRAERAREERCSTEQQPLGHVIFPPGDGVRLEPPAVLG